MRCGAGSPVRSNAAQGTDVLVYQFHMHSMAIARYKAVKEFEYDGVSYGIGNQLVLDPTDAQELVEKGKLLLAGYLDPEDPADAAQIERIKRNPRSFNGGVNESTPAIPDPKEGDVCDLGDGDEGVLATKRGKLVCVAKKEEEAE